MRKQGVLNHISDILFEQGLLSLDEKRKFERSIEQK